MEVKKQIMLRIYLSFLVICLMGLAILGQIIRIQFVEGDRWKHRQDSLTLQYHTIEGSRGNIFSADESLLASSVPNYDLRMDTRTGALTDDEFNEKLDSLSHKMADLFQDKSWLDYKQQFKSARASKDRYFLVKSEVSFNELKQVQKFPLFRMGRYKSGLIVEQKSKRELLLHDLASRTIGTSRDVKPVGIEASFEKYLKGKNGQRLMQRISGGWMPVYDKDEIEPKDGNDVVTTIEVNIQDVAENSLRQNLIVNNADHGCVVLMEVATGEVKAIANLSRNSDGTYSEKFNYAIGTATEPGSTFKMASLLAAIDDGLVDPTDSVNIGNGTTYYSGVPMKDSHPPRTSLISVAQAFEQSSNVGISKIITQHYAKHPDQFMNKLKSFGLGDLLRLQIEGEGIPHIKNVTDNDWSGISLPFVAIGYESTLTPLQILTFYNAIANNGRMVKPRFVSQIRNQGKIIESFPVEIIRDSIASPRSIAIARKLMEGVVERGTASKLNTSPYKIAGKTGTAVVNKTGQGYDKNNKTFRASFVGYFPADNPKYSCIVVVYDPSNSAYYGGAVAAPVFKDVADKVYCNHLEMHDTPLEKDSLNEIIPLAKAGYHKDLKKVLDVLGLASQEKDHDAIWVTARSGDKQVVLNERREVPGVVPDVKGMGLMDALYILENAGLTVRISGKGQVTHQYPEPGVKIQKGQMIVIELG